MLALDRSQNTGVSPLRIAKSGDAPVEMTQLGRCQNDAVWKMSK
jgi:hypothetical protein